MGVFKRELKRIRRTNLQREPGPVRKGYLWRYDSGELRVIYAKVKREAKDHLRRDVQRGRFRRPAPEDEITGYPANYSYDENPAPNGTETATYTLPPMENRHD